MAKELTTQSMNQSKAMYLLKTIWPGAPQQEIVKAGIICAQYNLNPLMRQIYLIQFGKDWVPVLGIKATRAIAQRKHSYSYLDGPRVMTEQEQVVTFGEADKDRLWAVCKLKDESNNIYPGYGFWPKDKPAYGIDKGNSPRNMAFIRAERSALDKMAPGELPDYGEVGDESFAVGNYHEAVEKGKREFLEDTEKDIEQLWGPPTTDADKRADGERKAKPKQHPDDDIHIPDMLR